IRRFFLRRLDLHLVVAILEYLEGEVVAGIVVVGFLHHLDAGGLLAGHQLLGKRERDIPVAAHVMQGPAAPRADPLEDFVMDFAPHAGMIAWTALNRVNRARAGGKLLGRCRTRGSRGPWADGRSEIRPTVPDKSKSGPPGRSPARRFPSALPAPAAPP